MLIKILIITLIFTISLFSFDSFYSMQKSRASKISTFEKMVKTYARKDIEHPQLKAVTLAMMILESGRGSSILAKKHNNFAGLKYRKVMKPYATKVRYGDGDGDNTWMYCKFANSSKFIDGFWAFLDRDPYRGWRKKSYSPEAFLKKIAPVYCPYNKNYTKLVMKLIPEAERLLEKYEEPIYKLASIN